MNLLRTLALRVWDALYKALLWAIAAGLTFWAVTEWAPSLNQDWAAFQETAIIQTDTGWLVVGSNS